MYIIAIFIVLESVNPMISMAEVKAGPVQFQVELKLFPDDEFKEFVQVTFEALKDKKLTVAEKEKMLKEWADMKPLTKQIKDEFLNDLKELSEDIKELYVKIKAKVKKKK